MVLITLAPVLALYGVKAVALLRIRSGAGAALLFFAAVAVCVPATWALSNGGAPYVAPVAHYVGTPIHLLTIPCVSFLVDLSRRAAGKSGDWYWRIPLEIVIGLPVWIMAWTYAELALGWVWI
jgi:hypothetical protein